MFFCSLSPPNKLYNHLKILHKPTYRAHKFNILSQSIIYSMVCSKKYVKIVSLLHLKLENNVFFYFFKISKNNWENFFLRVNNIKTFILIHFSFSKKIRIPYFIILAACFFSRFFTAAIYYSW